MTEDRRHWMPDISIRDPEWDKDQTDSVLKYFREINKGERISLGSEIGVLDEKVLIGAIQRGIKSKKIKWYWEDSDNMPSDRAIVSISEEKDHVFVRTSDVWLEKVAEVIPAATLPRFKIFGKEIGKKKFELKDDRNLTKKRRDDEMVRNLITDIYLIFRDLPD